MNQRSEWAFSYETPIVFAAAQTKEKHHTERAAFWKDEFRKADSEWRQSEEAFKSTQENFGSSYSNRPLQDRVQQCRNNANTHSALAKQYHEWCLVLAKASQAHLDLHMDDVLFFGLVTAEPEGQ